MKIKLTPKQQMVIELLQNGETLITNAAMGGERAYAGVTFGSTTIEISLRVFWNLVDKGLIYQGTWEEHRHNFVLTKTGKDLKFKIVNEKNK